MIRPVRQRDGEEAAFSRSAVNAHLATVGLNNVLDDRQPQAGTTLLAAAGFVDPIESFEQTRQMLAINAAAEITHGDLDSGRPGMNRQLHFAPLVAVLDGIIYEVDQRLFE